MSPSNAPKHFEVEQSDGPSGQNPLGDGLDIFVSVPANIQIRMVDASALSDYEVWIFISSLLCNFVVGFTVAYLQAVDANAASKSPTGWMLMLCVCLLVISLLNVAIKRRIISSKSKNIRLKTSIVDIDT